MGSGMIRQSSAGGGAAPPLNLNLADYQTLLRYASQHSQDECASSAAFGEKLK